ncbi:hypothetical protein PEX2_040560 [Penicillium expansum]|uniref:Protein kinase domain-containing protein n=1 Tax=Penicillium expansum TaxID=27334 RepID=A0A0A2K0D7_PENEN|nr:hypothetical protein PEX2_040560 [Penicillium expansum]KGO57905.1 hypothetical protein PEX2_040560 [Penicillium expansum]
MSLEYIQEKLREATRNPGTIEAFITYESVQKVWAGDQLEQFLKTQDPTLDKSEIDAARRDLLRMISILTGVVPRDWSGWSRFRQIFFPSDNVDADRRRDKNILTFTEEELRVPSFLGDTNLATHFVGHMGTYFPIIFNDHKNDAYGKNPRWPLYKEEDVFREGGFGEVTKEIIPPRHIILGYVRDHLGIPELPYPDKLIVARKRFRDGRFQAEVKQLKLLRSSLSSHKRIVPYLAMFFVGKELNIIMPWADMDLEDFLNNRYREMPYTSHLLDELIQESSEVASAIEFLHENLQLENEGEDSRHLAICHADLKPKNILVFMREGSPSTGVWRISDFGVSRVANRALSANGRHDSGYPTSLMKHPPKGGPYRAPEENAQRRSDIWSFGCILVRVFALGLDPASLAELDEKRKESPDGRALDDCFFRGEPPTLNPSVETWIGGLATRYGASHDPGFLERMQKLLRSMLEVDFRRRSSATGVRTGLHELYSAPIRSESNPPPSIQTTPRTSVSEPSSTSSRSPSSASSTGTVDRPRPVKDVSVLVTVIKSAGINQVRQTLQDEIDVEQCYEHERPLIHAIERSDATIVKELCEYQKLHNRKLDVRTLSSKKQTPLYLAVCKGDFETVRAVIDASDSNTDINTFLDELCEGKTPLMQAAFLGHAGVVSLLLARGADHRICVKEEKLNCLHFAVKPDNRAQADVIMAFKDKMDFDQLPPGTPLDIDGNPSKTPGYETPMMMHINLAPAGSYQSLAPGSLWRRKFNALLEGKADINRTYNPGISYLKGTPLQVAVKERKALLVRVLVDSGSILPVNYKIPPGISHDMKKSLKKALKKRPGARS